MTPFKRWMREDRPLFIVIALTVLATALVYDRLPDPMPIHWNFRGEVDGTMARAVAAWLLPALALGLYFFVSVLISADPRGQNHDTSPATLATFRIVSPLFIVAMHGLVLAVSLGADLDVPAVVIGGVGVLYAVIGNIFGRVRPNYIIGIRLPWTLESDEVWRKTHRFAAPLWFAGGCALVVIALGASDTATWVGLALITLTLVIAPAVFAYRTYQQRA